MKIFSEIKNAILERFTSTTKPSGIAGQIGYNSTTSHPEYHNGATWVDWFQASAQFPANTVFVSSAFNNVYPFYSSLSSALSSTSGDICIVVYQGNYQSDIAINNRSVTLHCVGNVAITTGIGSQATVSNSGSLYVYGKAAKLRMLNYGLTVTASNFYADVSELSIGLVLNYGNMYISCDRYTSEGCYIDGSSNYSSSFTLVAKRIYTSTSADSIFQFLGSGAGGLIAYVKCSDGKAKFNVTDNVKLTLDGGLYLHSGTSTPTGTQFINGTGSGYSIRVNNVYVDSSSQTGYPIIWLRGSAGVGTIEANGCVFKNRSWDVLVNSDSVGGRGSFYNCRFLNLSGYLPIDNSIQNRFLFDSTTKYDTNQF